MKYQWQIISEWTSAILQFYSASYVSAVNGAICQSETRLFLHTMLILCILLCIINNKNYKFLVLTNHVPLQCKDI